MSNNTSLKQMLNKKANKKNDTRILKSANKFIADSRHVLDRLHSLSLDTKKDLTLRVAYMTTMYSLMYKKRNLELAFYSYESLQLKIDLVTANGFLEKLISCRDTCGFMNYHKLKHRLVKKINSIERSIKKAENNISSCNSELDTYKNALDICSEFGRRLSFYLNIEE